MSGLRRILLQKSKIERRRKTREGRFLDAAAAARLAEANTKVGGRFDVKRCGPSSRRARSASAVFKTFVLHPKKTFATILGAKQTSQPRASETSRRKPETGAYPGCSASSCKSLQPQISRKSAEILPTFQRAVFDRECASSNPPRSANQCRSQRDYLRKGQKGPQLAGFCNLKVGRRAPE
jgi:hypothetical protein